MNTPSEDPLEVLLSKNRVPLADDGFSARVLASLPPPARKPRIVPNRRVIACGLGAAMGLAWALVQSGLPRTSDFVAFVAALQTLLTHFATWLTDPTVLLLSALVIASLIFAYAREIAAKLS